MKKMDVRYLDDYITLTDITLAEKMGETPELIAFLDAYNSMTFYGRLKDLLNVYKTPHAKDKAKETSYAYETLIINHIRDMVDYAKETQNHNI